MEATRVLSTLYEVRKFVNPIVEKELNTLILDLETEAKNKTQTIDERKQLVALRKFGKQCVKEMQDRREHLAGAFKMIFEGEYKWCLLDGYTGVIFNDVDGIPIAKVPNETFDFGRVISPAKYAENIFNLPDYSKVKADFDLAKAAYQGRAAFSHETDLESGSTVSTKKLLLFMEMLGIDGGEARQNGIAAPIYAAGNNVEGVLLPIRK